MSKKRKRDKPYPITEERILLSLDPEEKGTYRPPPPYKAKKEKSSDSHRK